MSADLFISYAWTSHGHREWVRLLAASLKAIGYDVIVDADVDYGTDLSGFMRRATDCRHVLLIVDENYVYRADNLPSSGVGIESAHFAAVYDDKPSIWLSVLFKANPNHSLPGWFGERMPKGHSFNTDLARDDFPGSEQVEELWRWIEDLPANRDHAVTAVMLRDRARRLETIDRQRDPNSWASPAVEGDVFFEYESSPAKSYRLGNGEYQFVLHVSGHSQDAVYVLNDYIHAVGINRALATDIEQVAAQLTPGRSVVAHVGEQAILQNEVGALCLVDILEVQREVHAPAFVPASLRFRYSILMST